MQVEKCATPKEYKAPAETYPLTFEAIKQKEGVYEPKGSSTVRLVVIKAGGGGDIGVLYHHGDTLEPAAGIWYSFSFRRTNERVCFELRPGGAE